MKVRRKPVVVDAVLYTGNNSAELSSFMQGRHGPLGNDSFIIHTLEGDMRASPGDWIIRGVAGEYYACKPDIFALTYELVTPA